MKKCFKCNLVKQRISFYKHPLTKDGLLNKCKDCTKSDSKTRISKLSKDNNWKDIEQARCRSKYRRLYVGTGKANFNANKKWKDKYPEKYKAISCSSELIKPAAGLEKHHWSYNDEHFKDVIWVTKKEHMKSHRFIDYDGEFKMYRKFDTNELLDSKQKHHDFINNCIKNFDD